MTDLEVFEEVLRIHDSIPMFADRADGMMDAANRLRALGRQDALELSYKCLQAAEHDTVSSYDYQRDVILGEIRNLMVSLWQEPNP